MTTATLDKQEVAHQDSNSGLIRQQWALLNVSMPCDKRGGRPTCYYSLTDKRLAWQVWGLHLWQLHFNLIGSSHARRQLFRAKGIIA